MHKWLMAALNSRALSALYCAAAPQEEDVVVLVGLDSSVALGVLAV